MTQSFLLPSHMIQHSPVIKLVHRALLHMQHRKNCYIISALTAGLAIEILSPFACFNLEYKRVSSPDGRFVAVGTSPLLSSLISVMPGGGSDKSGYITIYTANGRSCGRAPIGMMWMMQELSWSPGRAEIPLVAVWNLDACEVYILER